MLLALLLDGVLMPQFSEFYLNRKMGLAQHALLSKEKQADEMLAGLKDKSLTDIFRMQQDLYKDCRSKEIYLYIFENNSLLYWTSNAVFPQKTIPGVDATVQKLNNGTYLQKNIIRGNVSFIVLVPILYQYPIENQYLQNHLALSGADDLNIRAIDQKGIGYTFLSLSGKYLFSLVVETGSQSFGWLAWLFLFGLALCGLYLHPRIRKLLKTNRKGQAFLLWAASAALLFLLWRVLRIPHSLFNWPVFSSKYYASSYIIPSLGDLLVISFTVAYFIWMLSLIRPRRSGQSPRSLSFMLLVLAAVCMLLNAFLVELIRSLVLDSLISFDLSNIFSLNLYSFAGLALIAGWLYSAFRLASMAARLFTQPGLPLKKGAEMLVTGIAIGILAATLLGLPCMWPAIYTAASFSLFFLYNRGYLRRNYLFQLTQLVLASVFIMAVLSRYIELNQEDDQHIISTSVVKERDAIAEYLFDGIYERLQDDYYLKNHFLNPLISEKLLQKRIRQTYFTGYFSKYEVDVSSFTPEGVPYKSVPDKPLSFYTTQLSRRGIAIKEDYFYFLHTYTGLPSYVVLVPVVSDEHLLGTVMIQLQQKAFYEESVYPELLLSENLQRLNDIGDYSYAVYSNKILLNQKGEYPYPGILNASVPMDSAAFGKMKEKGYIHILHQLSPNLLVIVSNKEKSLLYYFSIFSFLLLAFGLCLGLASLLPYLMRLLRNLTFRDALRSLREKSLWKRLSFRYKILGTVIAGMTLALLLIGFVTVEYIVFQYNKDEADKLRKKTRQITAKLANDIQNNDRTTIVGEEELSGIIKNLSDLYQSDINVFDVQGNLISSTQNLIYERQIIAPKMDPKAFIKFNSEFASQIIQEEKIGQLSYTSSYMPMRNSIGQVIGFLNVPYFSKEQELKDRIASFLVALVNLYLLLFLILLTLGIFMTRALTLPLDIIRNHLRNTSLTGQNEFIVWDTNDEIGKLVKEYNAMIIALKENVARLSQSEREGAWREMAKQVAHEIKNPLTPMKLNIQRLQRAYHEHTPDLSALFEKVTAVLIKQIDNLSEIATEFSAFAQMPLGEPQPVDVNKLLQEAADLFSHHSELEIYLETSEEPLFVISDPNQLGRVLNNLIKNAIQAIPEDREGKIFIRGRSENNQVLIEVEDNGSGIDPELQQKIFIPNFSTKSSGMGLGLAIIKNIIERDGGRIGFETEPDVGTKFSILLPKAEEEFTMPNP
jgi:signal transduction histidine kinase